jgi:hypothetical protein
MTLSPLQVIYRAIALYHQNFLRFFLRSLGSTFWFLVSIASLFTIVVGLFLREPVFEFLAQLSIKVPTDAQTPIVSLMSIGLTGILFVFASARSQYQTDIIGRLAYQDLVIDRSEQLVLVSEVLRTRFWHFWIAEGYVSIVMGGVNRLIDRFIPDPNWSLLIQILAGITITGQYFLTSILIAVDRDTVRQALKDSRKQFEAYLIEICGIIVIAWLVTVPLYLLAFSPAIVVGIAEWNNSNSENADMFASIVRIIQSVGISIVLATVIHALIVPLWQSIKAVLYGFVNARSITVKSADAGNRTS